MVPMSYPSVLFVCEGNTCRSPMAEMLWKQRDATAAASSTGLNALVGAQMDPRAVAALQNEGCEVGDFEARQFTPVLARSSVVITMSRRQRQAVSRLVPSAYPRTFALLELAALVREFPGAPLRDLHRNRRVTAPINGLDIADPVEHDAEFFIETCSIIESGLEDLASLFTLK